MTETAIITLTNGSLSDYEDALAQVRTYLQGAEHCYSFSLLHNEDQAQRYTMYTSWETQLHRVGAWDYFITTFADAGVEVNVTLEAQGVQQVA